jgi:hypothetical protein
MKRRSLPVLAILAALTGSSAQAGEPLGGVRIVLTRLPPPIFPGVTIARTERSGRFAARVTEPGRYALTAECDDAPCPQLEILAEASGKPLLADAQGAVLLTVERPLLLRGLVQRTD